MGGGALGVKIGAAIGTLIAPGLGTVIGGALGGGLFSILGGMLGGKISDDLTGVNKKKDFETGTELQPWFTNNFFEKSVISSSLLIASAAGVTPQVKAEIRSAGLEHIPVENVNINTDIGSISRSFSSIGLRKNNLISEVIRPLPSIPGEPVTRDPENLITAHNARCAGDGAASKSRSNCSGVSVRACPDPLVFGMATKFF